MLQNKDTDSTHNTRHGNFQDGEKKQWQANTGRQKIIFKVK